MIEIPYKEQTTEEGRPNHKLADVYVRDRDEALALDTSYLIQGSKLFIIRTAELFVLDEDGGVWCSAEDGAILKKEVP